MAENVFGLKGIGGIGDNLEAKKEVGASVNSATNSVGGNSLSSVGGSSGSSGIDLKIDFKPVEGSSMLLDSISSKKEKESSLDKMKSILGDAKELEKGLEAEKEYFQKRKLKMLKIGFVSLLGVVVVLNLFFFYQLSKGINFFGFYQLNFGGNTVNKLENQNSNISSIHTQLNKYRFLSSQLNLNEFSFYSSKFLDATKKIRDFGSGPQSTGALSDITEAKQKLPELIKNIKQNLAYSTYVNLYDPFAENQKTEDENQKDFDDKLKAALAEDLKKNSESTANLDDATENIKLTQNAMKIVGNSKFLTATKRASAEKLQKDLENYVLNQDDNQKENLKVFFDTLLSSTKIDTATVAAIKNRKVEWDSILKRLDVIITNVIAQHNLGTNNNAEIFINSYDLNSNANKISLNGSTNTSSGTNTTLMSYLIDELEKSPYFENVSNRSFPKTRTKRGDDEGNLYNAGYRIELGLEKDGFSTKNSPIAVVGTAKADDGKVKRVSNDNR